MKNEHNTINASAVQIREVTMNGVPRALPFRTIKGSGTAVFNTLQRLCYREAHSESRWMHEHPHSSPEIRAACYSSQFVKPTAKYSFSFKALATEDNPWLKTTRPASAPTNLGQALKLHTQYLWYQANWDPQSQVDQAQPPDFSSLKLKIEASNFTVHCWAPNEWLWRNWFQGDLFPACDWVLSELQYCGQPLRRVLLNIGFSGGFPSPEIFLMNLCTGENIENCDAVQDNGTWRAGPLALSRGADVEAIFPALYRCLPWK